MTNWQGPGKKRPRSWGFGGSDLVVRDVEDVRTASWAGLRKPRTNLETSPPHGATNNEATPSGRSWIVVAALALTILAIFPVLLVVSWLIPDGDPKIVSTTCTSTDDQTEIVVVFDEASVLKGDIRVAEITAELRIGDEIIKVVGTVTFEKFAREGASWSTSLLHPNGPSTSCSASAKTVEFYERAR